METENTRDGPQGRQRRACAALFEAQGGHRPDAGFVREAPSRPAARLPVLSDGLLDRGHAETMHQGRCAGQQQRTRLAAPVEVRPTLYGARMPRPRDRILAARIRAAREKAGLQIAEVAERAQIGRNTISRLENAQPIDPRLSTLEGIARVCGTDLATLFAPHLRSTKLDAAIEDLKRLEAARPQAKPTPEEIRDLHELPPALWRRIPPSGEILAKLIILERDAKK